MAYTPYPADFDGHVDEIYTDDGLFLRAVEATTRRAVFVDEAGEITNLSRVRETSFLATRSRHQGHVVHFSSQRAAGLVSPIVRDQCTRLYLFRVSATDAKVMADEYAAPELAGAASLGPGDYFAATHSGVERRKLEGF